MLNTDAGITIAGTYIISQWAAWLGRMNDATGTYLLKLPTQRNLRYVELHLKASKTDRHEHFILVTIKTKKVP